MTSDALKRAAARAAVEDVPRGEVLGIGTGSTVDLFIEELAPLRAHVPATVASSERSRTKLAHAGFRVIDLNDVDRIALYVDGADEIDHQLAMIKGGGGALTREKIVAAVAERFVCVADESKRVTRLGRFPLPVEVIPMARRYVGGELAKLGGEPRLRDGFTTDNGNVILDVAGLAIADPVAVETTINQIAGVVTVGLFARRRADVLLLGTPGGVQRYG